MLGFAWVCSCSALRFLKRLVTSCEDLLKHIMCLHTFIERVIHSIRVSCLGLLGFTHVPILVLVLLRLGRVTSNRLSLSRVDKRWNES